MKEKVTLESLFAQIGKLVDDFLADMKQEISTRKGESWANAAEAPTTKEVESINVDVQPIQVEKPKEEKRLTPTATLKIALKEIGVSNRQDIGSALNAYFKMTRKKSPTYKDIDFLLTIYNDRPLKWDDAVKVVANTLKCRRKLAPAQLAAGIMILCDCGYTFDKAEAVFKSDIEKNCGDARFKERIYAALNDLAMSQHISPSLF